MKNIRPSINKGIQILYVLCLPLLGIGQMSGPIALYEGAEQTSAKCVQLTNDQFDQIGYFFFSNPLDLNRNFNIRFRVNLGTKNNNGADGLNLVLNETGRLDGAKRGGDIGYGGATGKSLAIEFDTYHNPSRVDLVEDHIALISNGSNFHNFLTHLAGPKEIGRNGNIEDGKFHNVRVIWEAGGNSLKVFVDCQLKLTYSKDIRTIFNSPQRVFLGFTGSTGAASNIQQVCWEFPDINTYSTKVCKGSQVRIQGNESCSYRWSPAKGLNRTDIRRPYASPDQTTTYILRDGYGVVQSRITVEVIDIVPNLTSFPINCKGYNDGIMMVNPSGGIQPYNYRWSHDTTLQIGVVDSLSPGSYQVDIKDNMGCAATATATIDEPDSLIATITEAFTDTCSFGRGSANANVEGGTAPYSFQWSNIPVPSGPDISGLYAGKYTLVVTDDRGCIDTTNAIIGDIPPAVPDFEMISSSSRGFFDGHEIHLINHTRRAVSYEWSLGDGNTSTESSPSHTYQHAGMYQIVLIADNGTGKCKVQADQLLEVLSQGRIFFPNAFSPNSDGHNDEFYAQGEGVAEFKLTILDRFGRVVYRFYRFDDRWDGRSPTGRLMPEGVYVYKVRMLMNDGDKLEHAGTVTLIR